MGKINWKPGNMIYPLPAVLVSCGDKESGHNLITISWTGTICTNPPMCYISVRPERHSYNLIKDSGEFVINLTTASMSRATDWCGVRSGRDYDKFKESGLTAIDSEVVSCPSVDESPISVECRVKEIVKLGSHDMFIADVVNVSVDDRYIDPETDSFSLKSADPIAYSHGHYFKLGENLGRFGWSVKKSNSRNAKKNRARKEKKN